MTAGKNQAAPSGGEGRSILERRAEAYASQKHRGRVKHATGLPYVSHLRRTAELVRRYVPAGDPLREEMLAAAWLHDVLEDTAASREELAAEFGAAVADMVWAVTDGPGRTREERKGATYPRIRATPGAAVIKLCDRIANVEEAREAASAVTGGASAGPGGTGGVAGARKMLGIYRREQRVLSDALPALTGVEARLLGLLEEVLAAENGAPPEKDRITF